MPGTPSRQTHLVRKQPGLRKKGRQNMARPRTVHEDVRQKEDRMAHEVIAGRVGVAPGVNMVLGRTRMIDSPTVNEGADLTIVLTATKAAVGEKAASIGGPVFTEGPGEMRVAAMIGWRGAILNEGIGQVTAGLRVIESVSVGGTISGRESSGLGVVLADDSAHLTIGGNEGLTRDIGEISPGAVSIRNSAHRKETSANETTGSVHPAIAPISVPAGEPHSTSLLSVTADRTSGLLNVRTGGILRDFAAGMVTRDAVLGSFRPLEANGTGTGAGVTSPVAENFTIIFEADPARQIRGSDEALRG